jgi:hypothetical protein
VVALLSCSEVWRGEVGEAFNFEAARGNDKIRNF